MSHQLENTLTIPEEIKLAKVGKSGSVKYDKKNFEATAIAAARLSTHSDEKCFIIPTYYGYTISFDERDTNMIGYYEVNGREVSKYNYS